MEQKTDLFSDKLDKNTIIYLLKKLDTNLDKHLLIDKCYLELCGTSSLILQDIPMRLTNDVDYINTPNENLRMEFGFPFHYAGGVFQTLDDYEDRLISIPIEFRNLNVFVISVKDLIVSKLTSQKIDDILDYKLYKYTNTENLEQEIREKYCGLNIDAALSDWKYIKAQIE